MAGQQHKMLLTCTQSSEGAKSRMSTLLEVTTSWSIDQTQ